jgi:hypothetical protein
MKMMVLTIPMAAAVIGALFYGLTSGKASELGRLLFFAGALAALLALR